MRVDHLTSQIIELAPKTLQNGFLYISPKFKSVIHLCCCGCGEKVVTPISPAEWRVTLEDGKASLYPSIGNWAMTCQSHYYIRRNKVVWAGKMSERQIKAVHTRDKIALEALHLKTAQTIERPAKTRKFGWFEKLKDCLAGVMK